MSEDSLNELTEMVARLEEREAARARGQALMQALLIGLVCAFAVQICVTVFYAGGKVVLLDRLVEDVREIKTDLYQMKPIRK